MEFFYHNIICIHFFFFICSFHYIVLFSNTMASLIRKITLKYYFKMLQLRTFSFNVLLICCPVCNFLLLQKSTLARANNSAKCHDESYSALHINEQCLATSFHSLYCISGYYTHGKCIAFSSYWLSLDVLTSIHAAITAATEVYTCKRLINEGRSARRHIISSMA